MKRLIMSSSWIQLTLCWPCPMGRVGRRFEFEERAEIHAGSAGKESNLLHDAQRRTVLDEGDLDREE